MAPPPSQADGIVLTHFNPLRRIKGLGYLLPIVRLR